MFVELYFAADGDDGARFDLVLEVGCVEECDREDAGFVGDDELEHSGFAVFEDLGLFDDANGAGGFVWVDVLDLDGFRQEGVCAREVFEQVAERVYIEGGEGFCFCGANAFGVLDWRCEVSFMLVRRLHNGIVAGFG